MDKSQENESLTVKAYLIHSLAQTVYYAKIAYYDGHYGIGGWSMSDEFYDKLEDQLKRLCPEHPILEVVGTPKDSSVISIHQILQLLLKKAGR